MPHQILRILFKQLRQGQMFSGRPVRGSGYDEEEHEVDRHPHRVRGFPGLGRLGADGAAHLRPG